MNYNNINKHLNVALKYSRNIETIKNTDLDDHFKQIEKQKKIIEMRCRYSYNCDIHQCGLLHGNIADSIVLSSNICNKKYADICLNSKCIFTHLIPEYDSDDVEEDSGEEY